LSAGYNAPYPRREGFPSWCWVGWKTLAKSSITSPYDTNFSDDPKGDLAYSSVSQSPSDASWMRKEVAFHRIDMENKTWKMLSSTWISDAGSAFYRESRQMWQSANPEQKMKHCEKCLVQADVPLSHALAFYTQTVHLPVDRETGHQEPRGFGGSTNWHDSYIIRCPAGRAICGIKLTEEYRASQPDKLHFILVAQHRRWEQKLGLLLDILHVETRSGITHRVTGVWDCMITQDIWKAMNPLWEFILMA